MTAATKPLWLVLLFLPVVAWSPQDQPRAAEREEFWRHIQNICGGAFEGRVVEAPPADTTFAGKRLVMHVRECTADTVRIPLHVGDDRSRTWVLTRTAAGLRLKHDHRHEDGSEDEVTHYGGDTAAAGTAERQEFPADAHTSSLIPEARTNVWTVEIVPGRAFVYALRREGTDRRYRLEFDLTRRVPAPPPPWFCSSRLPASRHATRSGYLRAYSFNIARRPSRIAPRQESAPV